MQSLDNNTQAFFALVSAGLWETDVRLSQLNAIDYSQVLSIAEEQSVVGLVAAGLEHVTDVKVPKEDVLQFIGQTLQLEQQNQAMNSFIGALVDKMRKNGIYTLLVKGQGIAQCYTRPFWRSCGDVDLFLDDNNYEKAKAFLLPLSVYSEEENVEVKHLGMTIDPWVVELHGTLSSGLLRKIDREIAGIQYDTFANGQVRVWDNKGIDIYIPSPDNDVIFVFTHILKHYFKGGIGLRQICDWCRLLYTYHETINESLLMGRLRSMGLLSEWKAFSAYAVDYLGMPQEKLPLYDVSPKWSRKARRINSYILQVGNFGHNRDNSFYEKYPFLLRKFISFGRKTSDAIRYFLVFPVDSVRFYCRTLIKGFLAAAKGIG